MVQHIAVLMLPSEVVPTGLVVDVRETRWRRKAVWRVDVAILAFACGQEMAVTPQGCWDTALRAETASEPQGEARGAHLAQNRAKGRMVSSDPSSSILLLGALLGALRPPRGVLGVPLDLGALLLC
jgi:hypothetical protein